MNKNKVNNIEQPEFDEQDRKIYEAFIELGWLIPQTEEINRAEKTFEKVDIPSLPAELEDSSTILERIKNRLEKDNAISEENSPKHNFQLVSNDSKPLSQNTQIENSDVECPTLLSLLKKFTGDMPSKIAQKLEVNIPFLRGCSDFSKEIPKQWKKELVKRVGNVYSLVDNNKVEKVVENPKTLKKAALRSNEYSGSRMTAEDILEKSGMDKEIQRFWLELVQENDDETSK